MRSVNQPLLQPIRPGRSSSMDFMGDSLADGRSYRTLHVIVDCARNALAIEIDISLTANRVVRVLSACTSGTARRYRSAATTAWSSRAR